MVPPETRRLLSRNAAGWSLRRARSRGGGCGQGDAGGPYRGHGQLHTPTARPDITGDLVPPLRRPRPAVASPGPDAVPGRRGVTTAVDRTARALQFLMIVDDEDIA